MPRLVPIYTSIEESYQADSCVSLVAAVEKRQVHLEALVRGHYPGKKLAASAMPGVKTVGYWDAKSDQDWGLPWHRNEGVELTFLESGTMPFAVEGREDLLRPCDLTITRPWQRHRVGNPNVAAGRLHWLILDVGVRRPNQAWKWPAWLILSSSELDELAGILRHTERLIWRGSSELRRCFQDIAKAVDADRGGTHTSRVSLRVNELLMLLLEMLRKQNIPLDDSLSSSRRTVQLFLTDLRTHPQHLSLPWTVESMAKTCGLRTTQFTEHVRYITNMTPVTYLNQCRLDVAAKLLHDYPEMSITEVALQCGFSSSQYFATVFRSRFLCAPREFQRR